MSDTQQDDTNERTKPKLLTVKQIRRMSRGEVTSRWDEVKTAMASPSFYDEEPSEDDA